MINFDSVSFKYSGKEKYAIKDINMTIEKNECILFVGKSGSGKSTILNLINGIIPNHIDGKIKGKVLHNGSNLSEISVQEISKYVGSVFQNPKSQFFNLDTTDELLFGLSNHKANKELMQERLDKTVDNLKMESLLDRNIFEISGGEKQKVACASVYMSNPGIIVFDEPSSNLDACAIKELKEIIFRLKKEGKTILISEHRLYYLMELVDRVVYIDNGEIQSIMAIDEFVGLTDKDREEMGLRSIEEPKLLEKFNQNISKNKCAVKVDMEISDFSYSYLRGKNIWNIEKLQFNKGEIIGIIGKNGVGKSTLAYSICGLIKGKGEIRLSSHPKPLSYKKRREVCSMVMQDVNHQLFLDTVLKELTLVYKENDSLDKARKIAEKLDLLACLDMHPLSLSGGQKQRVVISSAIMDGKEIIILDEPTSGLDFISMQNVSDLIKSIAKDKIILTISHDIEFINKSCTRVFCL